LRGGANGRARDRALRRETGAAPNYGARRTETTSVGSSLPLSSTAWRGRPGDIALVGQKREEEREQLVAYELVDDAPTLFRRDPPAYAASLLPPTFPRARRPEED